MKRYEMLKSVFMIYVTWCLFSLFLFYAGGLLPANDSVLKSLELISIVLSIFLAAFLTGFFIDKIEKPVNNNKAIKVLLLVLVSAIFLIHYGIVFYTQSKNSFLSILSTANLIFFACIVGNLIITPLKQPREIVPVCVVVAFADLFSVFAGPSRHFAGSIAGYYKEGMQGIPPFIDFLLIKIAVPGFDVLMPVFGVSDWIIIVFLTSVAAKFNMDDNIFKKGFLFLPVAVAGLLLSVAWARLSGIVIPALPIVIAVYLIFMMLKYPRMRKLTKKECLPMFILTGILTLLLILFSSFDLHAETLNRTFADKKYGYSIKHPSSWRAGIYRSGIVLSEINAKDGRSGLQIRRIKNTDDLDSFTENYIDDFLKTMGAEYLGAAGILIGSYTGYALSFRAGRSGKDYFLKSYIFKKDRRHFFIFQSGTPYSMRTGIEPLLDAIAGSFESKEK